MRRREFISLIGGAAAWPMAAHGQQGERMRRIGVLTGYAENDPEGQSPIAAFRRRLQELGWIEGRNLQIDYRWAAGDVGQVRRLAKELIDLLPDTILAVTTPSVRSILQETRTVPVIFAQVSDPVGQGIVASLAHPGGSATGFTLFDQSVAGKLLETLKEIAPAIERVALIANPNNPASARHWQSFEDFALSLSVKPVAAYVRSSEEIERSIESFAREGQGGLLAPPDVTVTTNRALVIALAARYRLPAAYWNRAFVSGGGLASYGPDLIDMYRHAAVYADRILRGERPADLPVQQPTKFELVINLKTAKALGLDTPPTLLARADEVIE